MSRVTEINSPEQLEDYRLVWHALFSQTSGASFFQTLDWLLVHWRYFGERQKLRVLLVTSNEQPIGIVPLTVVNERTRVGPIRVLTYPLADWASFYGPIGPSPAATLVAAMRHLAETSRDWDLLDLRWVDAERCDRRRTQRAMQWAGFQGIEHVWRQCAEVEITGTWDDYLATRSGRFRNELRRVIKRTDRLGGIQYVHHRPSSRSLGDGDPRWDLFDACVQVAERSWQGHSTTGNTLNHDCVSGFLRDAHALAAKNGMLDMHLLLKDERPIAFAYNYHHDRKVLGIRTGYDPEFARASIGNALRARVLRTIFSLGDQNFDLGADFLASKKVWSTRVVPSYRYSHYSLASPRTQLLRLKHWAVRNAVSV
jgi:CelD/BcsL family acetyltransferase involved in cellulose biosynthesis